MTEMQILQISQMRNANMGYGAISDYLGINKGTIKAWCIRHNLGGFRSRPQTSSKVPRHRPTAFCRFCGKEIPAYGRGRPKVFCSDKCRITYWQQNACLINRSRNAYRILTCLNCSRQFKVYGSEKRRYCSHECYINDRYYRRTA